MNNINQKHLEVETLEEYQRQYAANKPFPHLEIKQFLTKEFFQELKKTFKQIALEKKDSDLFTIFQSGDLNYSKLPAIMKLKETLSSQEFRDKIEQITEVRALSSVLDMSAQRYEHTSYLLPHDDRLEGRKIAYILYLSSLKRSEGGELQLFNSEAGVPKSIAKSIQVRENSFVIFTVSENSFHQVAEILTHKTQRDSIIGWYHG